MLPTAEFEHSTPPVHILLLEDEVDCANLVNGYLRAVSWAKLELETVETLAAALERLARGSFDLVIADLHVPDSSGIATLESLAYATDRLIIVLTADEQPALRERAIACGAYDFLHKSQLGAAELERLVRLAATQASTFRSLRESEARFRSLTELSSDWYWEQDETFRFTVLSRRFSERTGLDSGRHLGSHRWDRPAFNLSGGDWAQHRAQLERHEPFREFEMERKDAEGRSVWVSISGEPVFGPGGEFKGYRGVGRDITERKREERLLSLEHSVARDLTEASSVPAGLRAVMRAVCRSEGWECARYFQLDEAAGVMRFQESWSAGGGRLARFVESSQGSAFAPGQGLIGHAWQSREPVWVADVTKDPRVQPSARLRAADIHGALLFPVSYGGRVNGMLAMSSDRVRPPDERLIRSMGAIGSQIGQFLQRKQAEAALSASEARFRKTYELAASGIAHISLDGRFLRVNRALCESLGYSEGALIGRSIKELSHPEDRDVAEEPRARLFRRELESTRFEKRYLRRDGSVAWMSVSIALARGEDGEPQYEISVMEDISERRRAEQRDAANLRYQEKIARFGESALAQRDAGELLDEAVQSVLEGLGRGAVAYVERGAGAHELVLRAAAGLPREEGDGAVASYAPGDAIWQALTRAEQVRVAAAAPLPFGWASAMRSAVLIPVPGEQGVRGALCALSGADQPLGAEEARFLAAAASVLSAALRRLDSEGRLAFLAQFDALTGLPNRALLADRFSQMIVHARRHGSPLGVLFIDLDDFKLVNDTLGHAGGDELLKEVARRLQAATRQADTVARIAGDEFAVILGDLVKPDDAALVAQKIIDQLATPIAVRGQEVFLTASIGISAFPSDGDDAETLLGAADAAMYRTKQSGRNAYHFFTAEINVRTRARAQLGLELRHALEREELELAYQPKFDLRARRLCGAEALLRWRHPSRGIVLPAEFVPVLEETGLIMAAGEWVLRRVCADLKAWRAAGAPLVPIAVNLSARQFRQQDLGERIRDLVRSAGIDPALIELEITESQLMQDPDHAIRVMQALNDWGMRVAIDDFGTGYSSLSYLTRFPVTSLKIDQSFVADVLSDEADATIVRTIIDMAHTLGFTVIAEGVETEAQAAFLRGLGCEQGQGHLFASPMSAVALGAMLGKVL